MEKATPGVDVENHLAPERGVGVAGSAVRVFAVADRLPWRGPVAAPACLPRSRGANDRIRHGVAQPTDAPGVSVRHVLREQLEPRSGPVDIIVIDRVDRRRRTDPDGRD